ESGRRGVPLDSGKSVEKKEVKPVPPGSYRSGAIILLTDGRRTIGPDPIDAARLAADRGVKVYTVGFGSPEGGTAADLKKVYEGLNARYVLEREDTEIAALFTAVAAALVIVAAATSVLWF